MLGGGVAEGPPRFDPQHEIEAKPIRRVRFASLSESTAEGRVWSDVAAMATLSASGW